MVSDGWMMIGALVAVSGLVIFVLGFAIGHHGNPMNWF
jgi:hypothetical protein